METLNTILTSILEQQGRIEDKLDHALERMSNLEAQVAGDHEKIAFCSRVLTATVLSAAGLALTLVWTHVVKGPL